MQIFISYIKLQFDVATINSKINGTPRCLLSRFEATLEFSRSEFPCTYNLCLCYYRPTTVNNVACNNLQLLFDGGSTSKTHKKFRALNYHRDVVRGGCLSYMAPSSSSVTIAVLKKTFFQLRNVILVAILKVEHCGFFLHLEAYFWLYKKWYFFQFIICVLFP